MAIAVLIADDADWSAVTLAKAHSPTAVQHTLETRLNPTSPSAAAAGNTVIGEEN